MIARSQAKSFSMVELMGVIAIVAALIAAALFFMASYTAWSRSVVGQQNNAVLNDALNRYKGEGGSISALTLQAPIGDVFTALQTPVTWAGMTHQFLNTGYTYPARSLVAIGTGQQYQFYKTDTYTTQTLPFGTPTSQYPYGQGIGYLSNASAQAYNISVTSSSGYYAVALSGGATTCYASGNHNVGTANSITFWACTSGSNSTASGSVTALTCSSQQLTSLNVSGLTALTSIDCRYNNLASIDVSNHTALTSANNCLNQGVSCSLNISGCTAISSISINWADPCTTFTASGSGLTSFSDNFGGGQGNLVSVNLSNCKNLTSVNCAENNFTSLNLSGCTALTTATFEPGSSNPGTLNVTGCMSTASITTRGGTETISAITSPWANITFVGL